MLKWRNLSLIIHVCCSSINHSSMSTQLLVLQLLLSSSLLKISIVPPGITNSSAFLFSSVQYIGFSAHHIAATVTNLLRPSLSSFSNSSFFSSSNNLVGLTKIKIFLLIPCRGEILRIPRRISPLSLFRAFQQVFSADPSHLCKNQNQNKIFQSISTGPSHCWKTYQLKFFLPEYSDWKSRNF